MLLLFLALLGGLSLGLVAAVALGYVDFPYRVNLNAMLAGALAVSLLVPGVVLLGGHFVKQSALSYDEFWNGYETAAIAEVDRCERDGSCSHTYDCDPYPYAYTVWDSVSDGKGGTTSVPRQVTETRYHECPYATEEWTYRVETTLDGYTVSSNIFSAEPQEWRWGVGIPSYVDRGVPAAWQAVKDRLDRGDPGPVTEVHSYENYILASQSTILKRYSDQIETYKDAGMLPRPADRTTSGMQAAKAYGVGIDLSPEWRERVMRFNAALGTELQGDLHLVVIGEDVDKHAYVGALQAYWQSPELGDKALSKNALVVVLGTENGRTVEWAKAFTGMPGGNEQLLMQISSELPGTDLDPAVILGTPTAKIRGENVTIKHTNGLLEEMVWGPHEFARVCMVCEGEEDQGVGFSYLSSDIQPSTGQKVAIFSVALFVSALAWLAAITALGANSNEWVPPARQRRTSFTPRSSVRTFRRHF